MMWSNSVLALPYPAPMASSPTLCRRLRRRAPAGQAQATAVGMVPGACWSRSGPTQKSAVAGSAQVPRHGPPRVPVPPPGHIMRVFGPESSCGGTDIRPGHAHCPQTGAPAADLSGTGGGPVAGTGSGPVAGTDGGLPGAGCRPSASRQAEFASESRLIAVRRTMAGEIESKSAGPNPVHMNGKYMKRQRPKNLSGQSDTYGAFLDILRAPLSPRPAAFAGCPVRPRARWPGPAITEDHAWPGPAEGPGHARSSVGREQRLEFRRSWSVRYRR